MLQLRLEQLFPSLQKIHPNPLLLPQFVSLPYFTRFTGLLPEKQLRSKPEKFYKYFKSIRVERGTVIYASEETAEKGYILLNGCVQLLKKKSNREKIQMFNQHICHTLDQKQKYLYEHYRIAKQNVQPLTDLFYESKIEFRFINFQTLLNQEQFGFAEMVRNSNRAMTAIATQQSQLLIINKSDFDANLRDFHQKKENSLLLKLLTGCKQELVEQMTPKMLQTINLSILLEYENEDLVYRQNDRASDLFYIIEGQVEMRKTTLLKVPSKYMKHQTTGPIEKQIVVKVCKLGKGQFFGEYQIFNLDSDKGQFEDKGKRRQYTAACTLNNTIILKIDHSVFLKSITDFLPYYQMLVQNSKFRKINEDASYKKQYNKILKSFLGQYEALDSKKKQKLLSNLIDQNENKIEIFEAYSPEGVFFRDTFQKLEGFQEAQKMPNKKTSIKRFKPKSNLDTHSNLKANEGKDKDDNQVAQKLLFSPKRSMNIADVYSSEAFKIELNENQVGKASVKQLQLSAEKQKGEPKKKKSLNKFQQIQKDQDVYKRVLIKNGLFPIDRKIDKSKSVKALIHYNFDEIVKQCIARKNQNLKRSTKERQDQIVIESYQKAVQSLRNRSLTSSLYKMSTYTAPCKGTQELKKKMESMQSSTSKRFSVRSEDRRKSQIAKIEDCIGVNEKPKSSEISMRKLNGSKTTFLGGYSSPEKIVMLNHMMKPITYIKSVEL